MKIHNFLSKSVLFLSFIFGVSSFASAQGFEGTIEFKQITAKDTTINVYYVKGNKVKLDQLGKTSHKAEGTFLFDLSGNKITGLNPAELKNRGWKDKKNSYTQGTIQTGSDDYKNFDEANTKALKGDVNSINNLIDANKVIAALIGQQLGLTSDPTQGAYLWSGGPGGA